MVNHNIKSIKIPSFCEDLAEETGIHLGDGCMNIFKRKGGVTYYYTITLHALDDKDYINYIINKMEELYNIKPYIRKLPNYNTLQVTYFSKSLVEFKRQRGLLMSPKEDIKIPEWICNNKNFMTACIRGIVDTDGTIVFKKKYKKYHYYPMIKVSSISRVLIEQLVSLFQKFGINVSFFPYKSKNKFWKDCWIVQISGVENLKKYLQNIGFSNEKHITKLRVWEKYGFCPPFTTTEERKLILNGQLDPYSFYKNGSWEI